MTSVGLIWDKRDAKAAKGDFCVQRSVRGGPLGQAPDDGLLVLSSQGIPRLGVQCATVSARVQFNKLWLMPIYFPQSV
jgi:hypothetical protein